MKILTGNTYAHKDFIKSKGGKWCSKSKTWKVPEDSWEILDRLVNNSCSNLKIDRRKFECEDCGDDVYSGSKCWETGLIH